MKHTPEIQQFLAGKSDHTLQLFDHFMERFGMIGEITVEPTKTMIGISNSRKRIAWVTQLGKNFIHVVFPFDQPYEDNLCFQKIGQVPGSNQFNHHLRILQTDDVNEEVMGFMRKAYLLGE
ncbi:MAG TPA: DUF5655 domain-containing protein [Fluviicola sp.]|nr:DUF5655 domain-containing protein [Fluviicola sp.]